MNILRSCISVFLFLMASLVAAEATFGADFYVSPFGNDAWTGTLPEPNRAGTDGPLLTIEVARDKVRRLKAESPVRDIVVSIRGGVYQLDKTIVFDMRDSSILGETIVYEAYQDETPIFTAAKDIKGWRRLKSRPDGLPESSSQNVWVADITKGWLFHMLYDEGKPLLRSSSESFGPSKAPSNMGAYHRGSEFHFPEGMMREWDNLTDVELRIRPRWQWCMNILPLKLVDEEEGVAWTNVSGTYPLAECHKNPKNCWVENTLDFLDKPGEWAVNSKKGKVYLWPKDGSEPDNITASTLIEYIRVEGDIDFDGPKDVPVKGLVFKGLSFTQGERGTFEPGDQGVQHDYEFYDKENAMVRFRGAENCVVEECHFFNSGGGGIRIDLHGQNMKVVGNHFEHLGSTGVFLGGYGPGTKDVNRFNEVSNNWFHNLGEQYWTAPAVFGFQTGDNHIAHNLIHDMPYFGITISGVRSFGINCEPETYGTIRWHEIEAIEAPETVAKWKVFTHDTMYPRTIEYLHTKNNMIEYNEIFHIAEVMGDANAFYMTAAGRNNHFSRNYIHHLLGYGHQMGIRPDGNQVDFFAEENVLYKVMFGGIQTSGRNHYNNNIIVKAYDITPAGMRWNCSGYFFIEHGMIWSTNGMDLKRNIFYEPDKKAVFYRWDESRPNGHIKDTFADYNLFYTAADPEFSKNFLSDTQAMGIDEHSISEDPLFVDLANDNLQLRDDSPVYEKLNFRKIDMDKMGLEPSFKSALLGEKIMKTKISNEGGGKIPGEPITLSCSEPGAKIYYTTDGSHPTPEGILYTGPIALKHRTHLRAKSFKDGWLDLYGVNTFFLDPYEVYETFEELALGGQSTMAESGVEPEYGGHVKVVGGDDVYSEKWLEIKDTPRGAVYNPHLYYPLDLYDDGLAQLDFDLMVSSESVVHVEWRDLAVSAEDKTAGAWCYPGPVLRVEKTRLLLAGIEQMVLPTDEWIHITVKTQMGDTADGLWQLSVKPNSADAATEFTDLKQDKKFRGVQWLGWASFSDKEVPYWLDNIKLQVK